MATTTSRTDVELWGLFELALSGSAEGNPYLDVELIGLFSYKHRTIEVDGFYDSDGVYRIRFMPDTQGDWRYCTRSNRDELSGVEGSFTCVAPASGNHGPVRVTNTYHFTYADGMPYKQIGTTCYAWTHQGDKREQQTLETLSGTPFNKIRMCVFPKHYAYNQNEPERYPFPCLARGSSTWTGSYKVDVQQGWRFDFSRFDAAFFQHFERRVADLMALGIEADIILFHPYDRWGFATMDAETDDRYLRYIVARLAAYRNVWWSMANEFDFMDSKSLADWDRFFRIVQERDPYGHLRSIHNGRVMYDHSRPWVTHQSIQRPELEQVRAWRDQHKKPVVVDECCYEGNIWQRWGNISAREMVHRFWLGTACGGYVGHSETYVHPEDILWWAKGGVLHGESAPRLAFLRRILEDGPVAGLDPIDGVLRAYACVGQAHTYYLIYFGVHQPTTMALGLPEAEHYTADVVDIWEMTITRLELPIIRAAAVPLPGKPYQALIVRRVE